MTTTKFDARQSIDRNTLSQLTGAANSQLDTVAGNIDSQVEKLFEDRNIILTGGGTLTYTTGSPSTLVTTAAMTLEINSNSTGATPVSVTIASGTYNFSAANRMLYVVIDRVAGTSTITSDASTLPAQNFSNQEVFIIAKRIGSGGSEELYFRNGVVFTAGQSTGLGTGFITASSTQTLSNKSLIDDKTFIVNDADNTKIAEFSAANITTGTTRIFTLPNVSTTLVGRSSTPSAGQVAYWNDANQLTSETALSLTRGGTGISAGSANAAFNALSPMTTLGDTIYGAASGVATRLAGNTTTTKKILTQVGDGTNSAAPVWNQIDSTGYFTSGSAATPTANGTVTSYAAAVQSSTKVTSTNYAITTTDGFEYIICSSGPTITLPAASANTGRRITLKNTDGAAVTVAMSGSDKIDGAAGNILERQYSRLTVISDGANWNVTDVWDFLLTNGSFSSTSFSGSSWTNVMSVTIPPGRWRYEINCFIAGNIGVTGGISTASGNNTGFDQTTYSNVGTAGGADSNGRHYIKITRAETLTSTATRYFTIQPDTTFTMTVGATMYVTRED